MSNSNHMAPGGPGIPPRWTSSAKSGVGTALNPNSRVWFTISHGIFNEIFYPRVDSACIRDMGLIVTDGDSYFSEEKRHCRHEISRHSPDIPAYKLKNTCLEGRYTITKEIIADPRRDVIWQRTMFQATKVGSNDLRLHVLLAPHLGNQGAGNTAWLGDFKGIPMLFAERDGKALALACSVPWRQRSVGFVGTSDGWQDLQQHKAMTWTYDRAENGNVALTGEIALSAPGTPIDLVLGLGTTPEEAGHRALASLQAGFPSALQIYLDQWQEWHNSYTARGADIAGDHGLYRTSMAVIRTHASKRFLGGSIASLSIPWGFDKGDNDLGGYHLVWPRDLVETAGGLVAAGALTDARHILDYLQVTQEADGHWPQNMWIDGAPYWNGLQLDEVAFPILLVDMIQRAEGLTSADLDRYWPMVRKAASFLIQNGPVSPQDRWEEDPGYSPFTLAVEIAALLAAADLAAGREEKATILYLQHTADNWNANIERWTYVTNTDLAQEMGVDGYYVRIAPPETACATSPANGFVPIKNRPPGQSLEPAANIISPDALALVRFGLRAADDPRIVDTVKVIDAMLKTETPAGPVWHRYNEDGYGEHENGDPFDGTGVGRGWPLLTGERAHYELAAGHTDQAAKLLATMTNFANVGGLIPEQVWDAEDIPAKELFFGCPTGSAMPLVWAHAEYVKLCRSLSDSAVFDLPPQGVKRYLKGKAESPYAVWRHNHKCRHLSAGLILRIELLDSALVRWTSDNWKTEQSRATKDTKLGMHVADLQTSKLAVGSEVIFQFTLRDSDLESVEESSVRIGD